MGSAPPLPPLPQPPFPAPSVQHAATAPGRPQAPSNRPVTARGGAPCAVRALRETSAIFDLFSAMAEVTAVTTVFPVTEYSDCYSVPRLR